MPKGKSGRKPAAKHRTKSRSQPADVVASKPRRLRLPAYKPLRLKRIKYPEKLPSVWQLTMRTVKLFGARPKLFLGIIVIYAVLTLIFVRGFNSSVDVASLKSQFDLGPGNLAQLLTGVTVLTSLFTSSGASAGQASGAYQLVVGLLISLAAIWAARQTLAGQRVSLRDVFYKGMYPLVPFTLVLLVVVAELLPFLVGAWLFVTVATTGVAATDTELLLWGIPCLLLVAATLYMLCSSLFALYIVTLPDMTPIKALKNARQLVRYRRGQVFRKLIYMPVALLVVLSVIMLPFIIFVASIATWLFFVLSVATLVVIHLYMYTLYKALLS